MAIRGVSSTQNIAEEATSGIQFFDNILTTGIAVVKFLHEKQVQGNGIETLQSLFQKVV